MTNYIPADKLIAEIERKIGICEKQRSDAIKAECYSLADDASARMGELHVILETITSLQQEQSVPHWIHANYSDRPEIRHSPSGDSYLQSGSYMIWLSDLETLPKDGTDLTNPAPEQPEVDLIAKLKHHLTTTPKEQLEKEWKELEPWGNIGPTVQEFLYGKQPEVELDKVAEGVVLKLHPIMRECYTMNLGMHEMMKLVKSGFELGLNARKEE